MEGELALRVLRAPGGMKKLDTVVTPVSKLVLTA